MNPYLRLPSIGDLVAFESAARHGSFTKAAMELHLTQSAISRTIRLLEERIGTALFERVRQRVVLTDAGALYVKEVRRILEEVREATQRAVNTGRGSVLNIAVLPTLGTRWLVPRLPDFMRQHPEITINLATRIQPFDFRAEPFDGALHYGNPDWPGTVASHLMNEVMVPVCSSGFLRAKPLARPGDLLSTTLLHQTTRPSAWTDWFRMGGVDAPNALPGPRYEQFAMLAEAAAAGLGIALLPLVLVEYELAEGRLQLVFEHQLLSPNAYYWVVPEEKSRNAPLRAFTLWLLRQAHDSRRRVKATALENAPVPAGT